jgi:hypothetical protein
VCTLPHWEKKSYNITTVTFKQDSWISASIFLCPTSPVCVLQRYWVLTEAEQEHSHVYWAGQH